MWSSEALYGVRGCQWFICEEVITTNNWSDLIKSSPYILDIGQDRGCYSSEGYFKKIGAAPLLIPT